MALTATRLSPGVYSVNGKTIKATSSTAAISAYNKQYGSTPTKTTTTQNTTQNTTQQQTQNTTGWNEQLSNEAKRLREIEDARKLKESEQARLNELMAIKSGTATTQNPVTQNPVTTETPANTGLAGGADTSGIANEADRTAIERAMDIIQAGEGFGRRIGDEFYSDGSLGRVAEANTPEELAALEAAKNFALTVGNQTQSVADIIAGQRNILADAQNLSGIENEALALARSGLGGLASPEMEALRSAARQNIQGQVQSGMRDLARQQARNQVFGAAATAQRNQLGQSGVRESRNLERDLLVKNIDIKQAAQNAFTNLVTNTESNRAGRTNAASGQLSNTVLQDESNRNTAQGNAIGNQGTIATNLANSLNQLKQFNLQQLAAEKAGKVGSILGGVGTVAGQRGLLAGENFADQQYIDSQALQKEILAMLSKSLTKQGL